MIPPVKGAASETSPRGILGKARLTATLVLLILLALCLVFSWVTNDAMTRFSFLGGEDGASHPGGSGNLVDLHPWQTAESLAALAATAEETEYARAAERLADHEVDQAFAAALRQASLQRRSLTGEALTLSRKVERIQQVVAEDQARVQRLTLAAGHAASGAGANGGDLGDDLDVAKAQLGLDSDELADAQQDLARAGGDERGRIQQELSAHEAAMRKYDAQVANPGQTAVISAQRHGTIAGHIAAWLEQRSRYNLLRRARDQAQADAAELTAQHRQLESQSRTAPSTDSTPAGREKAATLAKLQNGATLSQLLNIFDDRIQAEQQLAAVYTRWSTQVLLEHRIELHLILQSLALVAFILICVILLDALVRHLVDRPTLDRRRMHTLRIIFKLGIQLVGALLILLVVFGVPSQMPTILGLTTAGLTVVLQDFIIAFFGWFVLMGKNGIRIGDWVEINGVSGEVVEIGLFRTAMLETGNWTAKGHPTGRRVTFINNFAIKGQYFNFSTVGQWMWDEIRVSIPAADDNDATIELIHNAVLAETEKDAQLAEGEWQRITRRHGLNQLTASTSVDLRPGSSGIDIIVRYVTRASDRLEVKNRLYQRIIGLLHKDKKQDQPRDTSFPQ